MTSHPNNHNESRLTICNGKRKGQSVKTGRTCALGLALVCRCENCERLRRSDRQVPDEAQRTKVLTRRLQRHTTPTDLLVDEGGYAYYDSRAADLLFEVVRRRHEQRSIILPTNKPFAVWNE